MSTEMRRAMIIAGGTLIFPDESLIFTGRLRAFVGRMSTHGSTRIPLVRSELNS